MSYLDHLPEGYRRLAIAVVRQAAKDYRLEYNIFLKTGVRSPMLDEVERWLTHGEGQLYSLGKGEVIMEMIRKGAHITCSDEKENYHERKE